MNDLHAKAAQPLWAKDLPLNQLVHRFTVGNDPELDRRLLAHDCAGSAAHARMLHAIGILNAGELHVLLLALEELHAQACRGELTIPAALEDGHTLIESELSARHAEAGAKIHSGRSRNDQVALAQNLYLRAELLARCTQLLDFSALCLARAGKLKKNLWPGYTHLQRAMPSSAAQWLASFAEAAQEEAQAGIALWQRMGRCPLGAAAGYGVPLPLDRHMVARLLGYSGVHVSPMDALAARQRHAQAALDWFSSCGNLLERFAWDISLYCTTEFGFLGLPDSLTTGSSIMPQKRNPDVAELLRAHARSLRGLAAQHAQSSFGLPSGYHRDWQLGKAALIEGNERLQQLLAIAGHVLGELRFLRQKALRALSPELYATAAAYACVRDGQPFRQAYRDIGRRVLNATFRATASDRCAEPKQVSLGSPERLGLGLMHKQRLRLLRKLERLAARYATCVQQLWPLEPQHR